MAVSTPAAAELQRWYWFHKVPYLCPDYSYTKLQGATENLQEPHNLGDCNIIHPRNLTTLEVLGTVFSTGS